ncbi:MAG: DMT family transporter [Planctomycetota bacterium]
MLHQDQVAALGAAMCWTGSSVFFGLASRAAGAVGVNQLRLFAAVPVMLCLHALTVGGLWPTHLSDSRLLLLALSGVVGLAIGDLFYFHALASIGPRLSSVVQSTWPAMALGLAFATAGEVPDRTQSFGIALLAGGVLLVVLRSRDGSSWRPDLTARQRLIGLCAAAISALGQASGMILSRLAMRPSPGLEDGVDPLSATVVRLLAGTLAVVAISLVQRQGRAFVTVLRHPAALRSALFGTVLGPVVGIWLSMVATRHADSAGTAAALMSLTPLFMLPVAYVAYRARIHGLAVLGTVLATAGTVMLLVSD